MLLESDTPAEFILGQPDFVSQGSGCDGGSLHHPSSACVDEEGTLWVSDTLNSRILGFHDAATRGNKQADVVSILCYGELVK